MCILTVIRILYGVNLITLVRSQQMNNTCLLGYRDMFGEVLWMDGSSVAMDEVLHIKETHLI